MRKDFDQILDKTWGIGLEIVSNSNNLHRRSTRRSKAKLRDQGTVLARRNDGQAQNLKNTLPNEP